MIVPSSLSSNHPADLAKQRDTASGPRGTAVEKLVTASVLALLAVVVATHFDDYCSALGSSFVVAAPSRYANFVVREFCNWWLYGMLGGVLALEWFLPAHVGGKRPLSSLRQDLLWALLWPAWSIALIPLWAAATSVLYNHYLWFLTIRSLADWPWWARVVLTLLVADFAGWLCHVARHKVPVFWDFHAVHHSQTNMNFFTEHRVHPVDSVVVQLTQFVPMMMVAPSLTYVVAIGWGTLAYRRFYHSNIRTNLGILRYLFVTPQSHRIHHSRDRQHSDSNYGFLLSIWDRIFGTLHRGYDTYPDTGIEDPLFPTEENADWRSAARLLLAQILYPFHRVARRWSSG